MTQANATSSSGAFQFLKLQFDLGAAMLGLHAAANHLSKRRRSSSMPIALASVAGSSATVSFFR